MIPEETLPVEPEADEEAQYRDLLASVSPEEQAEHRRSARRRTPTWATES